MRYLALSILLFLLIALVVKKFNKQYSYLECVFFTQCFFVASALIFFTVFIFVKYW